MAEKMIQKLRKMRQGGRLLAEVMSEALKAAQPGVSLKEINQLVEELIRKKGGKASFKKVAGYHWASCINLNAGVVHGIPQDRKIKEGDLVSLDIGFYYQGYHTDMAYSFRAGESSFPSRDPFLQAGRRALKKAIKAVKSGGRIGNISQAIQKEIEKAGFRCVETLTGHGIGHRLHEDPFIPCLLLRRISQTPQIKPGMALAIEVIYVAGSPQLKEGPDGWTISTQDGKIAALFEKTIFVKPSNIEVLTPYSWEKNAR